jgi:uncharacterized membrane protein
MKTIVTLGIAGGFFVAARGSISLFLVLLLAKRVSHELALALFKEAMKAGWFDEAR